MSRQLTKVETTRLLKRDISGLSASHKMALYRKSGIDHTPRFGTDGKGNKYVFDVEIYTTGAIKYLGNGDMSVGQKIFDDLIADENIGAGMWLLERAA